MLTGADEGFDLQVLFDPFEKQFHLSANLVDIGNGLGGQVKVVGQKNVALASLRIAVANTTQRDEIFFYGLYAGEFDGLIAGQAFVFQDRVTR